MTTLQCSSVNDRSTRNLGCPPQIQYFSRAFQPLKNSFVETLRAVIMSVRWFLVLLLLTLWGFAGALNFVHPSDF